MTKRKTPARSILVPCLILVLTLPLAGTLVSCSGSDRITSYGLSVEDLVVSREKGGPPAKPRAFGAGDKIYIRFSLSDFTLDSQGNLWIQEDLVLADPDGVPAFSRQNLLNDRVPAPEGTTVPVNNTITLFDTVKPGKYTIQINVRDKIGGGAVYIEADVTVRAP
jgi:hypothetical protein